jgi:hypothetical protein
LSSNASIIDDISFSFGIRASTKDITIGLCILIKNQLKVETMKRDTKKAGHRMEEGAEEAKDKID